MQRERNRRLADREAKALEHRPFKDLKRIVRAERAMAPTARPTPPQARGVAPQVEDDSDLFRQAVVNVVPLDRRERQRVAAPPPANPSRPLIDDDAEALAELSDLVTGKAAFDIADTDEHVEGAVSGIDPRLVRRLRRGEFVAQAHLDLHGMISDEARVAVDRFLLDAYRRGLRCVLIVHGRGHNSKDQIPVLKTRLKVWLARGQWSRLVLAFTSARACDGGTGALYVLLRRQRSSKRIIHVTEGAKR
jgi:DNA-nicking Smr family endonuclease